MEQEQLADQPALSAVDGGVELTTSSEGPALPPLEEPPAPIDVLVQGLDGTAFSTGLPSFTDFLEGFPTGPSAQASADGGGAPTLLTLGADIGGGVAGLSSPASHMTGGEPAPWVDGTGESFKAFLQESKGLSREVAIAYTKRMEKVLVRLIEKRGSEGKPVAYLLSKAELVDLVDDQHEEAERLMKMESKRGFYPHFREWLGMPRSPETLMPPPIGNSLPVVPPTKQDEDGVWTRELRESFRVWLEKDKGVSRERFQEYCRMMHRVLLQVEPTQRGLSTDAVRELMTAKAGKIEEVVRSTRKRRYHDLFLEYLGILSAQPAAAVSAVQADAAAEAAQADALWPAALREEYLQYLETEQGISRRSARTYAGSLTRILSAVLGRVQRRHKDANTPGAPMPQHLMPPLELEGLRELLGPASDDAREVTGRDKKAMAYLVAFQQFLTVTNLSPDAMAWLERIKPTFLSRLRTGAMLHKKEAYSVLFRLMPPLGDAWAIASDEQELERRICGSDPVVLNVLQSAGADAVQHLYDFLTRRSGHQGSSRAAAAAGGGAGGGSGGGAVMGNGHGMSLRQQQPQIYHQLFVNEASSYGTNKDETRTRSGRVSTGRRSELSMEAEDDDSPLGGEPADDEEEYEASEDDGDGDVSEEGRAYRRNGGGGGGALEVDSANSPATARDGEGSAGALSRTASHGSHPADVPDALRSPAMSTTAHAASLEPSHRLGRSSSVSQVEEWKTKFMQMKAAKERAAKDCDELKKKWQDMKSSNSRLRARVKELEEASGSMNGVNGALMALDDRPTSALQQDNAALRERVQSLRKSYSLLLRSVALQVGGASPVDGEDDLPDLDMLGMPPLPSTRSRADHFTSTGSSFLGNGTRSTRQQQLVGGGSWSSVRPLSPINALGGPSHGVQQGLSSILSGQKRGYGLGGNGNGYFGGSSVSDDTNDAGLESKRRRAAL